MSEIASTPPPLKQGDMVGQLTLVAELGKTYYGEVLWQCSCACGKPVLRAQHNLISARKRGVRSSCRVCWGRTLSSLHHNSEWREAIREGWRRRKFLRQWEATGSLYSEHWADEALADIREESDLEDPVDLPMAPFTPDCDSASWWPDYPENTNDEMTLVEIGRELGISRERVRQIEEEALKKLRVLWGAQEHAAEVRCRADYLKRHGLVPTTVVQRPPPPRNRPPPVPRKRRRARKKVEDMKTRDELGIPKDCLLAKEAAELLGWEIHTFHNRTYKAAAAGQVEGPHGKPWKYWSLDQIEALKKKYDEAPVDKNGRKMIRGTPVKRVSDRDAETIRRELALDDASESFPALLVVKAKESGITMTIPVFVQHVTRMNDGNHQVKVKLGGQIKDSILDSEIVVWARDLLQTDYSPFKTPWD